MLRSDLLKALARDQAGMGVNEVERSIEVFFDEIALRLTDGSKVDLRGFGTFSTRERGSRRGRNPRTGEAVEVPAKRVAFFKPHKQIRERLNTN